MRLVLSIAMLCALALPGSAEAGAWTKRKYEGLFILGLGYHWLEPFAQPDVASTAKLETSMYLEFGLTDRITLVGRGGFQEFYDRDEAGTLALAVWRLVRASG